MIFFSAAFDYFKHFPLEPVDWPAFEQECGVGVIVTPDQVEAAVEEVIVKHKAGLQSQRYRYNMGIIMGN